jgi:hypothetical protein
VLYPDELWPRKISLSLRCHEGGYNTSERDRIVAMRLGVITVLLAAPLVAQSFADFLLRPQLDSYLELTADQRQRMSANAQALNQWSIEKYTRTMQIQAEIAQETAKASPDALAIGMRYVELEGICRQGREKTEETRRNHLQTLTAAQRAKLMALEEAAKIVPLITEAQSRNLIGGPAVYSDGPTSTNSGRTLGGLIPANRIPAGFISFLAPVLTGCPGWTVNPLFPSLITSAGDPGLQH